MPLFHYQAVSASGEMLEGRREESDRAEVVRWLQAAGHIPISAEPVAGPRRRRGLRLGGRGRRALGRRELHATTEQLAVLLKAGMPLEAALQIARDTTDAKAAAGLLSRLLDRVRSGKSFSAALEAEDAGVSPIYSSIIATAEAAGRLDQGLERLALYLQRERALRDELISATLYPLILVGVALTSIALILAYVIPKISELFVGYEALVPLSTRVVIGLAELVRGYWWAGLGVLLAVLLGVRQQLARPASRYRWDGWLLRLPGIGGLAAKIETGRLARGLATLIGNGVPLVKALPLARRTLTNQVFDRALREATERLKEGGRLSEALAAAPHFPRLALQLVKVGEETGELEQMLGKLADVYDKEASTATKRLLAVLEPLLIVGLGVVIGAMIISILVAIVSVNDLPL